ncbi:MAG: type II secretion system minor pseudopilin GspH [Ectothiorhodospiraceae bacterium]|nr:type II secretion system minor pseudopilin GspH [Ectothiorhodospiraceae bacterium]
MAFRRGMLDQRGFTLIEIMVVMVIIGTVVTFGVLSMMVDDDRELEDEARRLHAVLELAHENALLEARELGLILEPDGYRFTELVNDEWRGIETSAHSYLRPRTIPDHLRLEIEVDGLPGEREPGRSEDDRPGIMLLSSGEITPFRIRLSERHARGDAHYQLRVELMGRRTLRPPEED